MKITRRELALTAGAVVLAPAQTAPSKPASESQSQAAREAYRTAAETLAKFEIPMATEPAFQFKP